MRARSNCIHQKTKGVIMTVIKNLIGILFIGILLCCIAIAAVIHSLISERITMAYFKTYFDDDSSQI